MDNNLKKIKELIEQAEISENDQKGLILLFANAHDEDLQSVFDLFSADPSWISKINNNYKAKKDSLNTANSEAWKRILEEEEKQLEGING